MTEYCICLSLSVRLEEFTLRIFGKEFTVCLKIASTLEGLELTKNNSTQKVLETQWGCSDTEIRIKYFQ